MRDATDKDSLSEVFREALKFYALAYQEYKKGSDLLILIGYGEIERLHLLP